MLKHCKINSNTIIKNVLKLCECESYFSKLTFSRYNKRLPKQIIDQKNYIIHAFATLPFYLVNKDTHKLFITSIKSILSVTQILSPGIISVKLMLYSFFLVRGCFCFYCSSCVDNSCSNCAFPTSLVWNRVKPKIIACRSYNYRYFLKICSKRRTHMPKCICRKAK